MHLLHVGIWCSCRPPQQRRQTFAACRSPGAPYLRWVAAVSLASCSFGRRGRTRPRRPTASWSPSAPAARYCGALRLLLCLLLANAYCSRYSVRSGRLGQPRAFHGHHARQRQVWLVGDCGRGAPAAQRQQPVRQRRRYQLGHCRPRDVDGAQRQHDLSARCQRRRHSHSEPPGRASAHLAVRSRARGARWLRRVLMLVCGCTYRQGWTGAPRSPPTWRLAPA